MSRAAVIHRVVTDYLESQQLDDPANAFGLQGDRDEDGLANKESSYDMPGSHPLPVLKPRNIVMRSNSHPEA